MNIGSLKMKEHLLRQDSLMTNTLLMTEPQYINLLMIVQPHILLILSMIHQFLKELQIDGHHKDPDN
jgi:hypothetical protein